MILSLVLLHIFLKVFHHVINLKHYLIIPQVISAFLGMDYNRTRDYSEETAGAIDREVADIMKKAYAQAEGILSEHIDQLHKLAKYLGVHEKIDGEDFKKIMTEDAFGVVESDPFLEEGTAAPVPAAT